MKKLLDRFNSPINSSPPKNVPSNLIDHEARLGGDPLTGELQFPYFMG